MSFFSTIGGIAKSVADTTEATLQKANTLSEDYRRENDDYLKRKLQSGSIAEKMAASKILKERGYGNQS